MLIVASVRLWQTEVSCCVLCQHKDHVLRDLCTVFTWNQIERLS